MAVLTGGREPEGWGKCEWISFIKGRFSEMYGTESNPIKKGCKKIKFLCC